MKYEYIKIFVSHIFKVQRFKITYNFRTSIEIKIKILDFQCIVFSIEFGFITSQKSDFKISKDVYILKFEFN